MKLKEIELSLKWDANLGTTDSMNEVVKRGWCNAALDTWWEHTSHDQSGRNIDDIHPTKTRRLPRYHRLHRNASTVSHYQPIRHGTPHGKSQGIPHGVSAQPASQLVPLAAKSSIWHRLVMPKDARLKCVPTSNLQPTKQPINRSVVNRVLTMPTWWHTRHSLGTFRNHAVFTEKSLDLHGQNETMHENYKSAAIWIC